MRRVVIFSLLALTMNAPQASNADVGPVQMPGTDRWYQVVQSTGTWDAAKAGAHAMNFRGREGHLVTVTSSAEAQFVQNLINSAGTSSFPRGLWGGGGDVGSSGGFARRWAWIDGPEAGRFFTLCTENAGGASCKGVDGEFSNWTKMISEPDSWGGVSRLLLDYENRRVGWWDNPGSIAASGYVIEFEASAPSAPTIEDVVATDSAVAVSWTGGADGGSEVTGYTVTASPGGSFCTSLTLSCTVTGLTNRHSYTFTVTATNAVGASAASASSAAVMPLAPGFQVWSDDSVLALGSSTTLRFAQSAASASIAVTGAAKAGVTADSAGFGSAMFTAAKAGVQKFTAAYSVKVGKKTTKYTATTQLYVPSLSGPMLKIKQGKTGKFGLQFMPPGAPVVIALTDGRTINLTADSAGKASTTQVFNTRGAVNYTVTVAGVQVATGGLTIS